MRDGKAVSVRFKFHYDSINSLSVLLLRQFQKHLNSIMILLIHNSENPNYIGLVNLNSIMILLIPF